MKRTLHIERLLSDVVVKTGFTFIDLKEQLSKVKENTGLQLDVLLNKPLRGIMRSYLMITLKLLAGSIPRMQT